MSPEMLSTALLVAAWPVVMGFAGYKVALVFGRYDTHREKIDVAVGALGGAVMWWGRVVYSYNLPIDWAFTFTIVGFAMMVTPELIHLVQDSRFRSKT